MCYRDPPPVTVITINRSCDQVQGCFLPLPFLRNITVENSSRNDLSSRSQKQRTRFLFLTPCFNSLCGPRGALQPQQDLPQDLRQLHVSGQRLEEFSHPVLENVPRLPPRMTSLRRPFDGSRRCLSP